MKNILIIIIIIMACCSCTKYEEWVTIVYQSKSKQFEYKAGLSTTLKECKEKGIKSLEINGISETGTFECGLNCKYDGIVFLVCETVVKMKNTKK